jgi:hypothetical protein
MPELDLDAYEAAYSRVERKLQLDRDWGALERRMRWRLRTPTWRLVRTLLLIALTAVTATYGRWHTWGVAIGLILIVLPTRVSAIKRRKRELAEVETAEDVRLLCKQDAYDAFVRAVIRMLLRLVLGAVFAVFGLVLLLADKNPWASTLAGTVLFIDAFVHFFVHLPRLARESSSYDTEEERAAEAELDDDDDDD